ncbi:chorismate synthase [Clostridium ihumii]|uniref:chorismate synthase n=1 Tax=Clostridium ihumii TaxID=1470356 RepID=UPI003D32BC8B
MIRFLDAGESHGKALVAILEGIPANFKIDLDYVNNELKRRQCGYGRGSRMKIENDKVEIWSGIRGNITTGNPITLVIFNRDFENWKEFMERDALEDEKIIIPRPGHGDLVGFYKYNTSDIRNSIERTSARETAIRTAVGAVCKDILRGLNIEIRSKVQSIGKYEDVHMNLFDDRVYDTVNNSEVRVFDKDTEKDIKNLIDICKKEGNTVGGTIIAEIKGVPLGIGSYAHYDRKLDGILSMAIMSLQGIKSIEIGDALSKEKFLGSDYIDEIYFDEDTIKRKSNSGGGIEAGVSNGENIRVKAFMKPIPSVKLDIKSVDLKNRKNVTTRYERSDVCGVVPASIVIENILAFEILNEILKVYPNDDFKKLKEMILKNEVIIRE